MAKTRSRSPRRRSASASSSKRTASRRTASSSGKGNVIRLKPLYNEISRVLKELERMQKRQGTAGVALLEEAAAPDPVSLAIARLTQHQADFRDICGPTMEIPPKP